MAPSELNFFFQATSFQTTFAKTWQWCRWLSVTLCLAPDNWRKPARNAISVLLDRARPSFDDLQCTNKAPTPKLTENSHSISKYEMCNLAVGIFHFLPLWLTATTEVNPRLLIFHHYNMYLSGSLSYCKLRRLISWVRSCMLHLNYWDVVKSVTQIERFSHLTWAAAATYT